MTAASLSLPSNRGYQLTSAGPLGWHLLGWALMLGLASQVAWGSPFFWTVRYAWQHLVLLSLASYIVAMAAVSRLTLYPRVEALGTMLLCVTVSNLAVVFLITALRLYYSRSFLLVVAGFSLTWFVLGYRLWVKRLEQLRVAIVPGGFAEELDRLRTQRWALLSEPRLPAGTNVLAVDLHQQLAPEWVRLLAESSLKGVMVAHAAALFEARTGRISLEHLSRGIVHEFQLPPIYVLAKRLMDLGAVILTAPLVLPLLLVTALAIRLDSKGPVLFWQERMGQGGRPFRMLKFRTMRVDAEASGARFAAKSDSRVTPFGKWLRRFRIDEIPQFWNILKGEMSLIGPRPEQVAFAKRFEEEISWYAYRHLVKPGITGWAQVIYGYSADTEETRRKLEHDLYYIKHLSFSLDFLVVMRTIRIILTGFGSR